MKAILLFFLKFSIYSHFFLQEIANHWEVEIVRSVPIQWSRNGRQGKGMCAAGGLLNSLLYRIFPFFALGVLAFGGIGGRRRERRNRHLFL